MDEVAGVPNRPPATRCPLELGFLPWPRRPVNSATASSRLLTMVGAIRPASSAFNTEFDVAGGEDVLDVGTKVVVDGDRLTVAGDPGGA